MNTITISNFDLVTSTAADEARAMRQSLLTKAHICPLVINAETQEHATNLLRQLRDFARTIETGREQAKAPVIKIGREIDALAEDLSGAVEREAKRLSSILGAYDVEQKKIAAQKREEAMREELRIRQEAAAKERAEQERLRKIEEEARLNMEREQAAIRAEAEAKTGRARTEAGRERAAKEAEEAAKVLVAKSEQDRIAREEIAQREAIGRDESEARRVADARQQAALAIPVRGSGVATSEKIMFEVTDAQALYEAAPYLVTLSPNIAAIRSALKGLRADQHLPGVRHWKEATTITRG